LEAHHRIDETWALRRPWHVDCAGVGRLTPTLVSASAQVLGYGLPPALRALVDRHQAARAKTTADQSVARRIRDGVRSGGLAVKGLTVYVHDGAVSLYGTLPSATAREDVLGLVSRVPGVRRIVDHLRIADA